MLGEAGWHSGGAIGLSETKGAVLVGSRFFGAAETLVFAAVLGIALAKAAAFFLIETEAADGLVAIFDMLDDGAGLGKLELVSGARSAAIGLLDVKDRLAPLELRLAGKSAGAAALELEA